MHAVWKFLLDDEFLRVYKYGIVLQCQDGIEQCIYPRIFTYSADYPEKCAFLFPYCFISFTDSSGYCLPQFETRAFVLAHIVSYLNQTWIDSDSYLMAKITLTRPASMTQIV
jgi:hypothetical protein